MNACMKWTVLALIAFGGAGCVSQVQYDNLDTLYRTSKEQIQDLTQMLADKDAQIKAMRDAAAGSDLQARLAKALEDRDKMDAKLRDVEDRLRKLVGDGGPLPQDLRDELQKLAAANPDLLTFDAKRGMVRISSDLTFDLGATDVKPAAAAVLKKLAAIINSPVASHYEAMIVGHTDNVRIGRPDTRAKHPTNWHLSVHRAIAVKDVLDSAGVKPERMCVAGYGEYRPIVANGTKGAEQNRRVEIFLVPSTATGIEVGPPSDSAVPAPPAKAPPARTPDTTPPEMYK
jgi:chemotaxis protein MotB